MCWLSRIWTWETGMLPTGRDWRRNLCDGDERDGARMIWLIAPGLVGRGWPWGDLSLAVLVCPVPLLLSSRCIRIVFHYQVFSLSQNEKPPIQTLAGQALS